MMLFLIPPEDARNNVLLLFLVFSINGSLTRYVKLRMRRECRKRFPHHHGLAIPTCLSASAWRTCRDACRDRKLTVSIEVDGRENVTPSFPAHAQPANLRIWQEAHGRADVDALVRTQLSPRTVITPSLTIRYSTLLTMLQRLVTLLLLLMADVHPLTSRVQPRGLVYSKQ